MSATALETLFAGVVFFGITLPLGLLTLRSLGIEVPPLGRMAVAMGVGLVLSLSLLLAELTIGGPWLLLPATVISLWLLRPNRSLGPAIGAIAPELLAATLLGSLALLANGGDVIQAGDGFSVRVGFDVSDRAFYGMVAQELERAPIWRLENPAFAPDPLQYSYLPALAGVLVHRYAGVDPLVSFGTCLPAFGLFFAALSTAALAQSFGASRLGRLLSMVLVSLGGDFSFLVPEINGNRLERTRHFFVFHSFGSEALFYNPWMFGLPLAFVTLICLKSLLDRSSSCTALLAALVLAALFQTKVFAFIPIWIAVTILALLLRHRGLGAVAALSLVLAVPSFLLVAASEGVRGGAPLAFEPLAVVREAIAINPSLERMASSIGFPMAVAVVVLGGFGFRFLGLGELLRCVRGMGADAARICLLTTLIAIGLALTFVGRPTRIEGVQFMFLAHALAWVFAGPALARMFQRSRPFSVLALAITGLAVVTPIRYLALKIAPNVLTSPASGDRLRFALSSSTLDACRWLRAHSAPPGRLVLPLSGDPENQGGLKPLYVGLLASRRVIGMAALFHVSRDLAQERQIMIQRLYETTETAEGESLLTQLQVDWVWEDAVRRLRFQSSRLTPRAEFGRTRLVQVAGPQ